jgi:predicted nucleic acid-binding protein
MVVIDASTIVAAISPDERADDARQLLGVVFAGSASTPALMLYECANTLQVKYRRGIFDRATRDELLDIVASFPLLIVGPDHDRMNRMIVPLAERYGISVYDASYLDLALQQAVPLATRDRRLRAAAEAERVALL